MGLLGKAALIGASYVGYKFLKDGQKPDATVKDLADKAKKLAVTGKDKLQTIIDERNAAAPK
jgi:hypothetical protein